MISSTCRDDDLRRSAFLDANSTYARVLLYPSTNRKILIPTKLGVENARLAFFYSSARRRKKCCLLGSHTCPAGSVNLSRQSKYSLVRQTYIFSNFHNPLVNLHCCDPVPYTKLVRLVLVFFKWETNATFAVLSRDRKLWIWNAVGHI